MVAWKIHSEKCSHLYDIQIIMYQFITHLSIHLINITLTPP